MPTVLVADDDPHLREVVSYALRRAGYAVVEAEDGRGALGACGRVDLVVLDIVMPELDGLEACRQIRVLSRVPIIFLSSRDEEFDRVLGLELGADDYLTKPFSPRELVARVKAVLRRGAPEPAAPVLRHGRVSLDPEAHRAFCDAQPVEMTVTEFALLRVLLSKPGKAWSRETLIEQAYGENYHLSDRTLDSHVRRIRAHFRPFGLDPIETVHGLGYRLGP